MTAEPSTLIDQARGSYRRPGSMHRRTELNDNNRGRIVERNGAVGFFFLLAYIGAEAGSPASAKYSLIGSK